MMCERDSYQMLDGPTTAARIERGDNNDDEKYTMFARQVSTRRSASLAQKRDVHPQQVEPQISRVYPVIDDTSAMATTSPNVPNDSSSSSRFGINANPTPPSPPHSTSPTASSLGVNLRVTGQCSQGGRRYMEDYFSVAYQQSENGDSKDLEYAFIGIYDGHGGAEAAIFAKEHLMLEIINQKLFWSESDQDVLRAIREGYIATHYAMWNSQEKWPRTANGLPSTAGTTATVAFIRREKIYIGHVGDSGIVLGYQEENDTYWRAKPLTTDHKPESVAERTRIANAGGKVIVKSGVPRVVWNRPRNPTHSGPIRRTTPVDEIPFLAVARSLGDLWSYNSEHKEFVVSPDPEVKVVKINPKTFRCLIFGTDGLWNVMSAQEAVDIVCEKESINVKTLAEQTDVQQGDSIPWTNPSKCLVDKALKVWSSKKMRADNTSVVTVILYPPNKTANVTPSGAAHQPPPNIGVEYMEMNGEIPLYEDVQTYQEVAEKYSPPKEYKNFNYYDDEDDLDILRNLSQHPQEYEAIPVKRMRVHVMPDYNYNRGYSDWLSGRFGNSNFDNTPSCDMFDVPSFSHREEELISVVGTDDNDGAEDEAEEDEEDDEADNEDEDVEVDVLNKSADDGELIDYASWIPTEREGSASDDANSGYNSFAESYNSLISGQITPQEASTSNSNPASYQSISGSSMHEIMQEQQQYQQECMSEEEGYSLTKLETRREQQRCKTAVQTFKIFQQQQQQQQQQNMSSTSSSSSSNDSWNCNKVTTFTDAISKLYTNCHAQPPQPPQQLSKPLDMNSLLQQERDEEAQVARERLQQQRHVNSMPLETDYINGPKRFCEDDEDDYSSDHDDYGDEMPTTSANAHLCDESVQIHEISSSSVMENCNETVVADEEERNGYISSSTTASALRIVEKIEKIEILSRHVRCMSRRTRARSPPPATQNTRVRANNVELKVLPTVKAVKICYKNRNNSNVANTQQQQQQQTKYARPCTRRATLNQQQSTLLARTKGYANIPNENQHGGDTFKRISNSNSNSSSNGNNISHAKASKLTPGTSAGKRQLRSNAGSNCTSSRSADYAKHTLRTRNTLTKDMKAKPQVMRHTTSNAAQLLRTAGMELLNGQTVKVVRTQQHSSSNSSSTSNKRCIDNSSASTVGSIKPKIVKAINLRSRQIVSNQNKQQSSILKPGYNMNIAQTTAALATGISPNLKRCDARQLRSNDCSNTSNCSGNCNSCSSGSTSTDTTTYPAYIRCSYISSHTSQQRRPASTPANVAVTVTTSPTPFAYCAAQAQQPRLLNSAAVLEATNMMMNSRSRALHNNSKSSYNNRAHNTPNSASSQPRFYAICKNSEKRATLRSGALAQEMLNSTMTRSRVQKMRAKR